MNDFSLLTANRLAHLGLVFSMSAKWLSVITLSQIRSEWSDEKIGPCDVVKVPSAMGREREKERDQDQQGRKSQGQGQYFGT